MAKSYFIIIPFLSLILVSCSKISKYYDRKGDNLFNEERYSESIKAFNKALNFNPKNIDAFHSLGRVYENMGDYKTAIKYYSEALSIDTVFALAYRSRGFARYKIQDLNHALEDYLISLNIDSNNATAYQNAGAIYKELCEFEKAREFFYISLKYEPNHWGVIDNLAGIEFDLGNYDSCVSLCYKVIGHLTENRDSPYGTLGLAYTALGRWDSSVVNLNRAIELKPDFATYYNNRGYSLVPLKRYSEALMDYNKAISLDSLNPNVFLNKADLFYATSDYIKAIENYDKGISLSKLYDGYDCGVCYNNRAWAKRKSGDINGYEEDKRMAKALGYPENYNRFSNLESCFYKKR
jgi:tetratricopeptide (TPR) repeat protein